MKSDGIKQKIRILPELEDLIPPLKEEEFEQLEANILHEGCREALLVWPRGAQEYLLIDGHNRLKICRKHKLDFRTTELHFNSLDEAKDYMIINQLGRRNLSPQQTSYLRGLRFQRERNEKGKYDRLRITTANQDEGKTAAKLADEYKVSQATIERDGSFAKGLDLIGKANPYLKREIMAGRIRLKKGMIRKASQLGHLPKVKTLEALISLLEGKPIADKNTLKPDKDERLRQQQEAKHKLLELCQVLEETPYLSKVLANNILRAAKELHATFNT